MFPILVPGKSKGLNHIGKVENGISYLGATNQNNGVLCFVANNKDLVQKGNCIAFIRNGEGSMGYSVYKAEDFIATSDMTLGYNEYLNKYVGTFITTVADRIRENTILGIREVLPDWQKKFLLSLRMKMAILIGNIWKVICGMLRTSKYSDISKH